MVLIQVLQSQTSQLDEETVRWSSEIAPLWPCKPLTLTSSRVNAGQNPYKDMERLYG